MGVDSRDYYRDATRGEWGFEVAPVVKYLILATVAVFVAQILFTAPPDLDALRRQAVAQGGKADELTDEQLLRFAPRDSLVTRWCALDPPAVVPGGQVWRVVTYAFCHDRLGLFHILLNMIALYWFGCTLEVMVGQREFLLFYLTAAVAGAAAHLAAGAWFGRPVPALGSSAAVLAVLMLYTWHFPREEIYVFWFFPLQMRFLMALFVIYDLHPLLLAASGDRLFTGVAHAAHLGGLGFGFAYAYFGMSLEALANRLPGVKLSLPRRPRPSAARRHPSADLAHLDQILAKISEQGMDSLTAKERAVLDRTSKDLRDK